MAPRGLVTLRVLALEVRDEKRGGRAASDFNELGLVRLPLRPAQLLERKGSVVRRRQKVFELFQSAIEPLEMHRCLGKCAS